MRFISVPITKDAMLRLDYNQCLPDDLEELKLDEELYEEIWDTGFFEEINRELGKNIDDYEDESICKEDEIKKLLNIILRYLDIHGFFYDLYSLTNIALNSHTGIFFFF